MTDKDPRIRLAEIHKVLFHIHQEIDVIIAKHTKANILDPTLLIPEYNARPGLRRAELTLTLANDSELQVLLERENNLEAERITLEELPLL